MGFGTTTMATGLHNVGYSGDRADPGVGNRLRGHGAVRCGNRGPSERQRLRRLRLRRLRCLLVGDIRVVVVQPNAGLKAGPNEQFGFFFVWTLFTLFFCIAAMRVGKYLSILFWLLLLAFLLLDGVTLGMVPRHWPAGKSLSWACSPGISPPRPWSIPFTAGPCCRFLSRYGLPIPSGCPASCSPLGILFGTSDARPRAKRSALAPPPGTA